MNEQLKRLKKNVKNFILKIREENSFLLIKYILLENILESSEIKSKLGIEICYITTFGKGIIPIHFWIYHILNNL